jgi:hypothetical protein
MYPTLVCFNLSNIICYLKNGALYVFVMLYWRYDNQHNNTRHNDTQHNNKKFVPLSIMAHNTVLLSVYSECTNKLIMLNIIMLSVVMLTVVMLTVVMLSVAATLYLMKLA